MKDKQDQTPGILSEAVRQLRTRQGLTQSEFAEKIGRSEVSVGRYETGNPPRGALLAKLGNVALFKGFTDLAAIFHHALLAYVPREAVDGGVLDASDVAAPITRDTIVKVLEGFTGDQPVYLYARIGDLLAGNSKRSRTKVGLALAKLLPAIEPRDEQPHAPSDGGVIVSETDPIEPWDSPAYLSGEELPPPTVLHRLVAIAYEHGLVNEAMIFAEAIGDEQYLVQRNPEPVYVEALRPKTVEERAATQALIRVMRRPDAVSQGLWKAIRQLLQSAEDAVPDSANEPTSDLHAFAQLSVARDGLTVAADLARRRAVGNRNEAKPGDPE